MNSWPERATRTFTPNYRPAPLLFTRGEGVHLYTDAGESYLDFAAGIAVCALGHNERRLSAALADQARSLLHVSNLFLNQPSIELAERLTGLCFADRVYFANSGAEANEAALKLARRYMRLIRGADRWRFLCAERSFHGRTWAAISATGQPKYHEGFAPLVPGFDHVPYNDLEAMRAAITEETCAIFVEPMQGEGGVIAPEPGYLQGLRALCDEAGILLIFDEVQTGVGRTGAWFSHQIDGVEPDIMTLAKGLGGGVPIGAMLCTDEVAQGFAPGAHASTFGGNPLACRAGLTVIDVIEEEDLLAQVAKRGEQLEAALAELVAAHPMLLEVRGRGLLRGIGCVPSFDRLQVVAEARSRGLLLTTAGPDALRLCPPLIIGEAHIAEAIERLDSAVRAVSGG